MRYYMTSQPLNARMEPLAHNITADYQVKRTLPFDIAASAGLSATQTIFIDGNVEEGMAEIWPVFLSRHSAHGNAWSYRQAGVMKCFASILFSLRQFPCNRMD